MVDIHAHVLPNVDDGSANENFSFDMLFEASRQGITDVILTPHFRREYQKTHAELIAAFDHFCAQKEQLGLDVNLYLGQEAFISSQFKKDIKDGKIFTLCGTQYLLVEFDFDVDHDVAEIVYDLVNLGFKPIVAHIERYSYADISVAREIKAVGGYIQVNAQSVTARFGKLKKKVKELFKEGLVDFVASDIHQGRENQMKKAYGKVAKRYGRATADAVFNLNAQKIIKG